MKIFLAAVIERRFRCQRTVKCYENGGVIYVQLMPGLFFKTYTTFLQTSNFLSPSASSECDIICILRPRSPMDRASHFDQDFCRRFQVRVLAGSQFFFLNLQRAFKKMPCGNDFSRSLSRPCGLKDKASHFG